MQQQRREFLTDLMGAAAAQVLAGQTRSGDMIYRTLGQDRRARLRHRPRRLAHRRPQRRAGGIRIIRTAIDRGITFMDNCWDYHDGKCEVWMGNALRDGYRKKVFLMTKFDGRTKAATAKQIDESLKRLQTDLIDLMQYHENIRMEDPDRFFAAGRPAGSPAGSEEGRARSATSASPATRIRWSTCACWRLRRSTTSISIRRRCR